MHCKSGFGPDSFDLRGTVDEPNKVVLVTKKEYKKNQICLVPWSPGNIVETEPASKKAVKVTFTHGADTNAFYITSGSITWDKEGTSVLAPFWVVGFAKEDTDDVPNMKLQTVSVKPGAPGQVQGEFSRLLQAPNPRDRGTFSFPILVNSRIVKDGTPLLRFPS